MVAADEEVSSDAATPTCTEGDNNAVGCAGESTTKGVDDEDIFSPSIYECIQTPG